MLSPTASYQSLWLSVLVAGIVVVLGLVLWATQLKRQAVKHTPWVLGCATAIVSLGVYACPAPVGGAPFFYFWVIPYAFALLTLRQALAQVVWMALSFGAVLTIQVHRHPGIGPSQELAGMWFIAVATALAVGMLVRLLQARLRHQAFHDPLTGLPNRALFLDRLGKALSRAERSGSRVAVIMLDLDGFKLINDSLGHQAGDELLVALAPRLECKLRGGDTVARLGGDEFAFLLEELGSEREATLIAARIIASMDDPETTALVGQQIRASLGIALADPGDGYEALIRKADTAMYRAKAANPGSWALFDEPMHTQVKREFALERGLECALERNELLVYYQPIVSVADGRLRALEAVMRWRHPEWGWVTPGEFIPIAERSGLIVPAGRWMVNQVVRQAATWRREHHAASELGVFVNLSPRELSEPDLLDFVNQILGEHGTDAGALGVEVTERAFLDATDTTLSSNMRRLSNLGIRLSLDDFGTGYSSIATLERFHFASIKIDKSFIRHIDGPSSSAPILAGLVALGQSLGLEVVAEGVETKAQARYLRHLGCDAAQGYHFARPQPASALDHLFDQSLPPSSNDRPQPAVRRPPRWA